jgi:hypothetical protein
MVRTWFVEKVEVWGVDGGPVLLIHDTCDSIAVPIDDLEDFLVRLGEVMSELGYFDGSDLLKFMIKQVIKDSRPNP